ncbi:hypothetical protein SAMN05661012_05085 [Chitinophaga sancti]|uniref:Uncharacterized protein n=1 Tax=Chitinophaga sancti TaxID=1004 RepID=A0A1K1SAW2_9BACT|nr:hypothetical protein SAMN05661012_05085 [Chitinophaga sancti]
MFIYNTSRKTDSKFKWKNILNLQYEQGKNLRVHPARHGSYQRMVYYSLPECFYYFTILQLNGYRYSSPLFARTAAIIEKIRLMMKTILFRPLNALKWNPDE